MESLDGKALALLAREPSLLPNLIQFPWIATGAWYIEDRPLYNQFKKTGYPTNIYTINEREEGGHWEEFNNFPPSLTSFKSRTGRPYAIFQLSMASLLPSMLTSLDIGAIEWKCDTFPNWPPSLTTLKTIGTTSFSLRCFRYLPRCLKTLDLGNIYSKKKRPGASFDDLCTIGRECLQPDASQWSACKSSILSMLHMPLEGRLDYINAIESGRLFGLPLSLTSFNIEYTASNVEFRHFDILLPPHATEISIMIPIDFNSKLFHPLPPSPSLQLSLLLKDTTTGTSPDQSPQLSTLANSYLQSLSVGIFPRRSSLTFARALTSLPQSLQKLRIYVYVFNKEPKKMKSSHLKLLPPKLESFSYPGLLADPFASWVECLPLTLVELDVPKLVLTGKQIKFLPRSLLLLTATLSKVSPTRLLDFPRTLHTLDNRSESTDSSKYLSVEEWKTIISTYRPFWRIWESGIDKMSFKPDVASQSAKKSLPTLNKDAVAEINDIDPRVLRRFCLSQ